MAKQRGVDSNNDRILGTSDFDADLRERHRLSMGVDNRK